MKRKHRIARWVFLVLAVLTNGFLITYSCLSAEITDEWNWFVTNLFSGFVNTVTEKEVKEIPMTDLNIKLSEEDSYAYNYVPGYNLNQIPLGSAKQIEAQFLPLDTTDKYVEYYTENNEYLRLVQDGNKVSVIGIKEGKTTVYAKNNLSGLTASCEVEIVDTVAPTDFEVTIDSPTIQIGNTGTLLFDIDGGSLGHNELLNFRYYDIRKLSFASSNEDVFTVDNNGIIHPQNPGNGIVTIKNNSNDTSKDINIEVVAGISPVPFADLHISGSTICYENDIIKDQSSGINHYQLEIYEGDVALNSEDFVWSSSDELLVKIDRHGIMRGFRKRSMQDEAVVVTATSKVTNQSVNFEVTIKEQLPESMSYWVTYGEKDIWMPTIFTACNGDTLVVHTSLNPNVSNKNIIVESSNLDLIKATPQGNSFALKMKNIGECTVSFKSESNNELTASIVFTILKAGAIDKDNIRKVGLSLRKVLGHAFVFGIAQIFTFLACYFFLREKRMWIISAISLSISLVVAIASETIEHFIPGRSGTVKDVFIDMAGVLALFAIVFVVVYLLRKKHDKQNNCN